MIKKTRAVLLSVLWGSIVILFTVASGVVCSVAGSVDSQGKIWLVQGIFSCLSLLPAFLYIRRRRLSCTLIKDIQCSALVYLPCLLVLAPMVINGFAAEDASYFLTSAFFTLAVGVSEELYFRGIVFEILHKSFHANGVVLVSTFVFGLGHAACAFSGMDLRGVILTIINALIFGWLAAELLICTNTLLPLMLFHFLFDWLSKAAPMPADMAMTAEIVRGTVMFVFALVLCLRRLSSFQLRLLRERN